jgi:TRAP-type mannitol/chloroaromatic compound transport system permease small subunit
MASLVFVGATEKRAPMIRSVIKTIDLLNKSIGHAFAWCIVILTLGVSYEVFVRYVLKDPTSWAFDLSYILYGALFIMSGAYTLSRGGHVRADIFQRRWRPRTQAMLEIFLYLIFFFPGVLALVFAGWGYGMESYAIREVSVNSPVGVPIWPLKMLIPAAGLLLSLQGVAEVLRAVLCLKEGAWPPRTHDVEELEATMMQDHQAAAANRNGAGA